MKAGNGGSGGLLAQATRHSAPNAIQQAFLVIEIYQEKRPPRIWAAQ
jgi:hypothetical protein